MAEDTQETMEQEMEAFGKAFVQYMQIRKEIQDLNKLCEELDKEHASMTKQLVECSAIFHKRLPRDGDVMLVEKDEQFFQLKKTGNQFFVTLVDYLKI